MWEKMRLVLWPKHLLGGFLRGETGVEEAERGESRGFSHVIRSGRWPGTDVVLQQKMSEGLRDWDLWHVRIIHYQQDLTVNNIHRGPLIFCLLLSLLLSLTASSEQKTMVFSGVFALVWVGEAVVTLQIKLLGGNM